MKTPPLPHLFPFAPTLRLCCAAALLLAGSACSQVPPKPATAAAPAAPAPEASLKPRIDSAIGDAACDSQAQCATLALGHKACGGPERYVAWSSKVSDGAALADLAARLAEQRTRSDAREGMMSTCRVVVDPGASCQAGRCVLAKPGPGGPPVR